MITRDRAMATTQLKMSRSKSANTMPTNTLPRNSRIRSNSTKEALVYKAGRMTEESTTAQAAVATASLSSCLKILTDAKVAK